ncbi:sulfite exporter TauE/SafE family protein [Labilibaculum sp.]|uniref:sulfite exporter TauE/SafE family protein n=1 Tax=Labilibaculum sp. TaxID=2060723 RepID=UPI003567F878
MIFHSSVETFYFLLPLLGFIIGLFGTMLGGGGGFFFLPILTLFLGVPAQTAVITSLVATLPIGIIGTASHYRKGNVNPRIGFLFAIAGIMGAIVGAGITSLISENQLKVGFGIYSILIAFHMIYNTIKQANTEQKNGVVVFEKAKASFFGLCAGLITGTFGTSGTAPILAGLFSMNIPLKMVIGTSLMVVLTNSLFAVGAHFLVGTIDLTLVGFLTIGSTIGALLGPFLLSKVKTDKSESKVKYIYALVIVAIGIAMIIG